jgi:hypothetical protein
VWNFAYSLTRRSEVADDIRQDMFVKAYDKLDTASQIRVILTKQIGTAPQNVCLDKSIHPEYRGTMRKSDFTEKEARACLPSTAGF